MTAAVGPPRGKSVSHDTPRNEADIRTDIACADYTDFANVAGDGRKEVGKRGDEGALGTRKGRVQFPPLGVVESMSQPTLKRLLGMRGPKQRTARWRQKTSRIITRASVGSADERRNREFHGKRTERNALSKKRERGGAREIGTGGEKTN